jgi:hypothetical protein
MFSEVWPTLNPNQQTIFSSKCGPFMYFSLEPLYKTNNENCKKRLEYLVWLVVADGHAAG